MPTELPAGHPITELVFIPTLTTPRNYLFYGYGNITVLFDCQQHESRHEMRDRLKTVVAGACKALSDETRLEILRLIALKNELHGKLIAKKVGLSASAVSRHLSILKDNDLIIEKPQDNKIAYQINHETVDALSQQLMDYLHS
jgi:DNA-binding transcriptional ArsR family regulator